MGQGAEAGAAPGPLKLLMFGATGQVAREVRARLPATWELEALSRQEADLADPQACARRIANTTADVVLNAAAFTAVDKAEQEEALATTINGEAPGHMAFAAAARGLPFLHLSTDYVFAGSGTAPWQPSDALGPLSAYGRSKLVGEQAVQAAGGRFAIVRTSWVFSAHGQNFVKTMLRLGAERSSLRVVGDQVGGPTPAAAIADLLLRLAARFATADGAAQGSDTSPGGLYHFSGSPDVSWADFAREIFRQARLPVTVEDIATAEYPTPAQRPANSRLDCSATEAALGVPRPDWRAHLAATLQALGSSHTP